MTIKQVQCPMCNGMGYSIEPILDDGSGPKEYCGYCKGKGVMPRTTLYYQCLGWLSADKRRKLKNFQLRRAN